MKDEDDDGDENEEEDDQLGNKFFPSSASQIQPLPGGPVEPKESSGRGGGFGSTAWRRASASFVVIMMIWGFPNDDMEVSIHGIPMDYYRDDYWDLYIYIWGFPKMEVPSIAARFIRENPS